MSSTQPSGYDACNRYTRIIVDEALARGLDVEVVEPGRGELRISDGTRSVSTFESLSELTSAVAFRRCDHKPSTREVLTRAGLRVPAGRMASFDESDEAFLAEAGELVVKPARGEQGWGITVGVTTSTELDAARTEARRICDEVLLEQRHHGDDLRIVVIDGEVVAASVRRPPVVVGNGTDTVAELVEALSAERSDATGGAARIPLDEITRADIAAAGSSLDAVLGEGEPLQVRRTANLHTGGTIDDVTDELHPDLAAVALEAAIAIDIPVLGLDLIVPRIDGAEYVIIEGNEQPGLANHEPRPTVERFVDLLFPDSATPRS